MNINLDMLVEMVEKQLNLLEQETVQSIYKNAFKLRLNKAMAADLTQIINEIRGIQGVTTVTHKTKFISKGVDYDTVVFDIKYELMGSAPNPVAYLKRILIPNIRKIRGVDILDAQANPEKLS